jgi:hypothetical protein
MTDCQEIEVIDVLKLLEELIFHLHIGIYFSGAERKVILPLIVWVNELELSPVPSGATMLSVNSGEEAGAEVA